ncbi:MAG TPA: hypothetical protein VGG89_06330 [Candidatus Baltobacteraceae bacterium]
MLAAALLMTITIESAIHTAYPIGTIAAPVTHGDLAIVSVDVVIEGSRTKRDMLLQRYPFGWQMIELGRPKLLPCQLKARAADAAAVAFFAGGIGLGKDSPEYCSSPSRDVGHLSDVVAVRSLMNSAATTPKVHAMIPSVHIIDGYALGAWYGAGGGETIFAKRNGVWKEIAGGGGAYAPSDLTKLGVPPAAAEKLAELNAP